MTNRWRGGLDKAAVALAVTSILATVCAGVAAGVSAASGDPGRSGNLVRGTDPAETDPGQPDPNPPKDPHFDYSGWKVISGTRGESGHIATYRIPANDWKSYGPDYAVSFRDKDEKKLASGHALANYYGNDCSDSGNKIAGGWTVIADTGPSGDLKATAEASALRWAKGYATNAEGTTGDMNEPDVVLVGQDDGTTAARALIEVDLGIFTGPCLPEKAELMVTTIDSPDGTKSLVQARYLVDEGGITDRQWTGISQSFAD